MTYNELQRNSKNNFNLDDYLEEQAEIEKKSISKKKSLSSTKMKIGYLIIAVALLTAYFMNPLSILERFNAFSDSNSTEQSTQTVTPTSEKLADSPEFIENSSILFDSNIGLVEYLATLKTYEISDNIPVNGADNLFNEEVPLNFIKNLEISDLFDDLTASEIINIYRKEIPLSYIKSSWCF